MSSFLCCIGDAAERLLPGLFTAFSCCAAPSAGDLDIFCLSSGKNGIEETGALASDLTAIHHLTQPKENRSLFPCTFKLDTCSPLFRSAHEMSETPETSLLFSVLRGKGLPFSYQTDREAVEWAFSDLLSRPDDPSILPFIRWLEKISTVPDSEDVRLTCMADLSDPFSAGIALSFLCHTDRYFKNRPVSVYFIALAEPRSPLPDSFVSTLYGSLQAMEERKLLRSVDDAAERCVEAAWILSMPSSMIESTDSFLFLAPFAARIIGKISGRDDPPSPGLHTVETEGLLSLSMLRENAGDFAEAMSLFVWLVSDILPAAQNYLSRPARLRSISVNLRTSVFRRVFSSQSSGGNLEDTLRLIERTVKKMISLVLRYLRSVPSSLRLTPENAELWQKAVDACGRTVTVAAEYDLSSSEAHESGLDAVRPVHRVSMADTDEEQLIHRLEDIKAQLDNETKARNAVLSSLGGYRSIQVRMDCLNRCKKALNDAQAKAAAVSVSADRLAVLKLERRIRLLTAAVSRCESELTPESLSAAVSLPPQAGRPDTDPYLGTVFIPESCHMLEKMTGGDQPEAVQRYIPLFPGMPESDLKTRWKSLSALCGENVPSSPLCHLLSMASDVCHGESDAYRFLSHGNMPDLPLLPDLVPHAPLLRLRDVLSLFPDTAHTTDDTGGLRGIFATLLLVYYRRRSDGSPELQSVCVNPSHSPLLAYWLRANCAERAFVFSLVSGENSFPLAICLPGERIIMAKILKAVGSLIPSFATWYDRENGLFADPCSLLGEGDRKLLSERLNAYISSLDDHSSAMFGFLSDFLADLTQRTMPSGTEEDLMTRIRAVCAFQSLSAYADSLRINACRYEHFHGSDLLGAGVTGKTDFPASACSDIPEGNIYLYRETPFAREDTDHLLAATGAPGEDQVMKRIASECSVLADYSDDYRDAVVQNAAKLIERFPGISPEIRRIAESVIKDAEEPVGNREPEFEWPWDVKSPSVMTVLQECLGTGLSVPATSPFSDLLAVFPARGHDVIGDAMLSSMCSVLPYESHKIASETSELSADAVLPPLSAGFANALCSLPEGHTLIHSGLFHFVRNMNESISVTITLDGVFPLRLVRVYQPEEILHLYSHDIPTIAVWPSVPFPAEYWKAYYIYAHLPDTYTAFILPERGSSVEMTRTTDTRYTASLESFPVCISLYRSGMSIGALLNVLPRPFQDSGKHIDICIDFGSSATSVVLSSDQQRTPLHGPVMVRTLLNNPVSSRDLLRREFLPAVPVSALLPTVSRIFRNVPGADPVPFEDGIVLMSSDLEDLVSTPSDAIYSSLKWEEQKGRSGFLCLHQIMLMAALQARCDGASVISWRFSLPDEMAMEGKEFLMNLYRSLCEKVLHESGFPSLPDGLPVSFASDSAALGAYFRYCAYDNTGYGFMVLDLGACTADISLFLRGREQAVRTCQIPLGIQYMLLPVLLKDPELLLREFSFCDDTGLRRDLSLLTKALSAARTDSASLRRARIALDYLITDHHPLLISCLLHLASVGTATKTGALMLFHLAYLLMLSGLILLQIAADPTRNDFLPEQMSLCLAGRGSSLMESLPPAVKNSLWHFLSMFRNKRIASLSLLFSSEKKLEIPVGLSMLQSMFQALPPASVIPASVSLRPSEFLPAFLMLFRKEFPASSEALLPGFFTNDFYHPFTARGEIMLSASIDQSFTPAETPRPYDLLASWPGNLLDLVF